MKRRPTPAEMQDQCANFNAQYPVGAKIRVWSGIMGEGPGRPATIVRPGAYMLSGHTAVVQVTGGHGCIALSHVLTEDRMKVLLVCREDCATPLRDVAQAAGLPEYVTRKILTEYAQHGWVASGSPKGWSRTPEGSAIATDWLAGAAPAKEQEPESPTP